MKKRIQTVVLVLLVLLLAWRFIPVCVEKALPRYEAVDMVMTFHTAQNAVPRSEHTQLYFDYGDPALEELYDILTKQCYFHTFYPKDWWISTKGYEYLFDIAAVRDGQLLTFDTVGRFVRINGKLLQVSKLAAEELMLSLQEFMVQHAGAEIRCYE